MNPVDVTSTGGPEWLVNKKNRGWHRRFRLRKTAGQPPTMQGGDKHAPKKIAEEWEKSTVWPSSKKPPQAAQQRTNDNENPLRFTCSLCRDGAEYVPKDLVGHFEENHAGIPPVFSCHMCTFSAGEFSYLQVHLLSHKDTFSSCAVCEDNVQRTWSEFRAHLAAHHFQDGKYSCKICREFSTGDVGLFLEHAYAHHLTLDGRKQETDKFVLKAAARTLRCQHCSYEVSRKLLINNDIRAVHICSGGDPARAKAGGVRPAAVKPNNSSPKMKLRLTRSAVREMCWLTQDCLSLPGREFLDKYCHLSDPHTTLEETQEFLMKSVAGETGDPEWTEALKSVLSNVPQEINLHPMSDGGKVSNSSDLTVLTVENKITVAQNGAAYCKKLKTMTSVGKEAGPVTDEAPAPKGRRSDLNISPPVGAQTPENRKNQEGGVQISGQLKLANEREAPAPGRKTAKSAKKRQSVRRKRKVPRRKRAEKEAAGRPLKLVLKKNPVREKQWVTQSCEGAPGRCPGRDGLETAPEETESCRRNGTQASGADPLEPPGAIAGTQQTEPRASSTADVPGGKDSPQVLQGDAEAELGSEDGPLRSPGGGSDASVQRSAGADGGPAPSGPVIPLQGQRNSGDLSLAVPSGRTEEGTRDGDVPADPGPGLGGNSDVPTAIRPEPVAAARPRRRPTPKSLERTLKLVAISPYQRVRRPAGNQPVVVLNHPDADIPEVARIMEVINRYKGAVRKVVLSRRTLRALSAAGAEVPKDPTGLPAECDGHQNSCVQERFLLRLKLRRLSGKKYKVVGGASPSREAAAVRFCCWFCGRVFGSQETWVLHRRRHLMEWK
ncbi:uncharacterized protein znf518a isoform X1 [Takifugu rubripes]|uniref:Uncharacterized LOC105416316 n=1 Tax=Takifugu rubripes TaxID=31033 RepID=H2TTV0_TAKRU|nr:uncharacterized protein LOC105416316 isoform X1 [Takifugu rubripes]XP_029690657.1 uncharacterized protein LOC105416316 isoform X1 [Takifugu rubripes]